MEPESPFALFAHESQAQRSLPIAPHIAHSRIGFEASHFLNRILTSYIQRDPLFVPTGSVAGTARQILKDAVQHLKKLDITPFFVFDGLDSFLTRKNEALNVEDILVQRSLAWETYQKSNRIDLSIEYWQSSSRSPTSREYVDLLISVLDSFGIEYIIAPFSAAAQLKYFENREGTLDAVYASFNAFMFGFKKLITNIEPDSNVFQYIELSDILQLIDLDVSQLADTILLSGFKNCPTFSHITTMLPAIQPFQAAEQFRAAVELVHAFQSGNNAILNLEGSDVATSETSYFHTFCRAKLSIKYHIILAENGNLQLLRTENPPSDVHDFMQIRLPDEMYFYMSRGLADIDLIKAYCQEILLVPPPLDNGDSTSYKTCLETAFDIIALAFSTLVNPLGLYFHSREVAARTWYDPAHSRKIFTKAHLRFHDEIVLWNLRQDDLGKFLKGDSVSFVTVAKAALKQADTELVHADRNNSRNATETVANSLGIVMQLRNFFDKRHLPSDWGVALISALEKLPDDRPDLANSMLLIFELLRNGQLANFTVSYGDYVQLKKDEDKESAKLLLCVACAVPIERHFLAQQPMHWPDKLNKYLLAFYSCIHTTSKALSKLIKATVVTYYLNALSDRSTETLSEVKKSIEWSRPSESGCIAALVLKTYIERLDAIEGDLKESDIKNVREAVASQYAKVVPDAEKCIDDCLMFWDAVYIGAQKAQQLSALNEADATKFESANTWLKQLRSDFKFNSIKSRSE